jgi:hypothetical protein
MPTPRRWTVAGYRPASRLLRKQWSRCWGVAAGERILAAYPYACMYADYLRGETVAAAVDGRQAGKAQSMTEASPLAVVGWLPCLSRGPTAAKR